MARGRHEKGRIQDGESAEQKHRLRGLAENGNIHLPQGSDHLLAARIKTGAPQDRGT